MNSSGRAESSARTLRDAVEAAPVASQREGEAAEREPTAASMARL